LRKYLSKLEIFMIEYKIRQIQKYSSLSFDAVSKNIAKEYEKKLSNNLLEEEADLVKLNKLG